MRLHRKLRHPNRMICKKCIISTATRVEVKKKRKKGAIQGDDDLNIVAKRIIVYCGYDFNILQSKKCGHCVYFLTMSKTAIIIHSEKKFAIEKVWFLATFLCAIDNYGQGKMRLLNAIENFIMSFVCQTNRELMSPKPHFRSLYAMHTHLSTCHAHIVNIMRSLAVCQWISYG